ncbi:MAG: phosphate-starvation-inducible PsiE family protein [Desulfurococcales archaeon]|nr:phosphate-starvation-inducible PsiE family protein [Desulfurococcales archaeon]
MNKNEDEGEGRFCLEKNIKNTIAIIELLLAAVLAATILIATFKIALDLKDLISASYFEKTVFLHILDSILLTILAIDLMRTLVTAVIRKQMPISIVVEVAILALLRELIAIEIKNPSNARILTFGMVLALLVVAWIGINWFRIKVMEQKSV